MRPAPVLALLALLVSGVALSLGIGRGPADGASGPGLDAGAGPGTLAELERRIAQLEHENRGLRDRLALQGAGPAADPRPERAAVTPAFATREELEALRAELLARTAVPAPIGAEGEPDLHELVAASLQSIRHDEAVRSAQDKLARRADALDQTLPKVADWLQLTGDQAERMRTSLGDLYAREAERLRRWAAGEDPEELGEQKRLDREQHLADVAAFLSPSQFETYAQKVGGK